MKHTPGPWTYDVNEDGELLEMEAGNEWVSNGCGCCGSPRVSNVEDARLMAAAPDLLDALKNILSWAVDVHDPRVEVVINYAGIDAARAAIAKATGENNG